MLIHLPAAARFDFVRAAAPPVDVPLIVAVLALLGGSASILIAVTVIAWRLLHG